MKKLINRVLCFVVIIGLMTGTFMLGKVMYSPTIPVKTILSSIDSHVGYKTIYKKKGKSWLGNCSGVILSNTPKAGALVITASHCIKPKGKGFIEGFPAVVLDVSPDRDLALVGTSKYLMNKKPIKFPKEKQYVFDEIYHIGTPNNKLYFRKGKTILQSSKQDIAILKVIPGCSGGGVYNIKGELIGIATATSGPLGFYESVREVMYYIANIKLTKQEK